MNRRDLFILLANADVARPLPAAAQASAIPVVAFLRPPLILAPADEALE